MAAIAVKNLQPAGSDLLFDTESFMNELGQDELTAVQGGGTPLFFIGSMVIGVAAYASEVPDMPF